MYYVTGKTHLLWHGINKGMDKIFNRSKYTCWYYKLVQFRQLNPPPKDTYTETHHIIPESFYINRSRSGVKGWLEGDPDAVDNKVVLTGREHALCHWLLTKMTKDDRRAWELMVYSFNMMQVYGDHQDRTVSRMITRAYERNRIEWSELHSSKMKGRSAWNKGKKLEGQELENLRQKIKNRKKPSPEIMEEANKKRAEKLLGKKQSQESREKRSKSMTGFVRGPMSVEEKLKRSVANKGKKKTKEFADNCAIRMKENFQKNNPNKNPDLQKICPHCLGKFGPTNFKRWHGDNCKKK